MVNSSQSAGSASVSAPGTQNAAPRGGALRFPSHSVVKRDEALSFVSYVYTKRGRHLHTNYFDVPPEEYGDGWVTGTKAAAELMVAIQARQPRASHQLLDILRDASAIPVSDPRRGASAGFLRAIEDMLRAAADTLRHQEYFAKKAASLAEGAARVRARDEEQRKQERDAFVARMKAAKAAKRELSA